MHQAVDQPVPGDFVPITRLWTAVRRKAIIPRLLQARRTMDALRYLRPLSGTVVVS
jgi:hypothetical protein